ncbi:hypothetical protein [Aureivirga sp. CE67]|uniref:hypothetical protein n=1 Tax=Aureivirga sp. CE67 TaxID=1788983 RepID=UPI0018CB0EFA|nr:hypothetical protein [Aureivirga sp. CE67]
MKKEKKRGYLPIEFPDYDKLNWDMDLSIKCLDVLRIKIPLWFPEFPKNAEYDLISYENPFGAPYPVIGIHCEDENDFKKLPSFIDLFDEIEEKITDEVLNEILEATKNIDSITWEKLKEIGTYSESVKLK